MKKLTELNGWELMQTLAELAEPVGNIVNDESVWECFKECTKNGVGIKTNNSFRFLLKTYAKLAPLLLGDGHRKDTLSILAAVEGKPLNEIMQMNGAELLKDFSSAYKGVLEPFFTKSARSGQTK